MHILLPTLRKKHLSSADVMLIMVEVRKFIEKEKLEKEFGVLSFYCNWMLHSTIDRNPYRHTILSRVNDYLINPAARYIHYIPEGSCEIICALDIKTFQSQLTEILFKMTKNKFYVSNRFLVIYFKSIIDIKIIPKDDYPELETAIKNIQLGGTLVNTSLKHNPSFRYDPNFEYQFNPDLIIINFRVKKVIKDVVIFEMFTKGGMTIDYELYLDLLHEQPFVRIADNFNLY